jgi:hypothetical protein
MGVSAAPDHSIGNRSGAGLGVVGDCVATRAAAPRWCSSEPGTESRPVKNDPKAFRFGRSRSARRYDLHELAPIVG